MTMPGMGVDATVQAQYAQLVGRVLDYCKLAVADLTLEEFCDTQGRRTNSIAFDVWHVQRTIDNIIHFAFDRERPVWLVQGFDEAWGLPRVEQGTNMTPDEAYDLVFPGPEEFDRYTEALRDAVVPRIADHERRVPDHVPAVPALGRDLAHGGDRARPHRACQRPPGARYLRARPAREAGAAVLVGGQRA